MAGIDESGEIVKGAPFAFFYNAAAPITLWSSTVFGGKATPSHWAMQLQSGPSGLNVAAKDDSERNLAWCVQSPAPGPAVQ